MPPYTGLGTWDDSMGSVLRVTTHKKPSKDLAKLFFNDGKMLRFSAKFSGSVAEEDVMRRFLITYYLYDDCLMIHETPQRTWVSYAAAYACLFIFFVNSYSCEFEISI